MLSYEQRLEIFIADNKDKLDKLKKIQAKLKKVEPIMKELKDSVQNSLIENNLQGYSDNELTISKRSGSMKWDFKKDLTKEQKDEIRDDLISEYPDYFEYRKTTDSWTWKFSAE